VDKRQLARTSVTRGSIITFESVEEPGMTVMKRVVGIPGDTLAMVEGRFLRNGQPVDEPYIISGESASRAK
jgi:signal peptidase I